MYETDFTGWTRTPENLKRVKNDPFYRWKLHCKRLWKGIITKRYWDIPSLIKNVFTNHKHF